MAEGGVAPGPAARGPGLRPVMGVLAATLALAAWGSAAAGERWGWLGIRIRDLTEREMDEITLKLGVREGYGVLVADVIQDAPAATSSLRTGDLVVAIGGRPVVETRDLQRIVGSTPAGQELSLLVLRDDRRREVKVRVGQMPPEVVADRVAAEFGFVVRDPSPDDIAAGRFGRAPVVGGVAEGSSADHAGLAAGDRILALDGTEVASVEDFRRRAQEVLLRDTLRLSVERKGQRLVLVLAPVRPAPPPQ